MLKPSHTVVTGRKRAAVDPALNLIHLTFLIRANSLKMAIQLLFYHRSVDPHPSALSSAALELTVSS
jgi:hypothetical protein